MQMCNDAGKNLLDVIWVGRRQVCGPFSQSRSIETVCHGTQDEESQSKYLTFFSVLLCNATS